MTAPTGTFQSYQQIGTREDLSNIIENISPLDTVFSSNIERESVTQTKPEWQTDSLDAAADNAQIDGDDATTNTATPTVRLANYTQILTKVPRVSERARQATQAGRQDELDYQIIKRGRELKRDREFALLSTAAATAGVAAGASHMAGVAAWLWTNVVANGSSSTTTPVTSGAPLTAPTSGTALTFTETMLKSALKQCWDSGGNPGVVLVNSFNKQNASAFAGISTQYRAAQPGGNAMVPGSIIGAADVYVSDFGTHQIVASRFMPTNQCYVLDMEYWKLGELYPIKEAPLAKTGLSDRVMLHTECTLIASAPSASGKVYALTTS